MKIQSKDVGKKTRIMIGERQDSSLVQAAPQPVTITVESIRHISDRCPRY